MRPESEALNQDTWEKMLLYIQNRESNIAIVVEMSLTGCDLSWSSSSMLTAAPKMDPAVIRTNGSKPTARTQTLQLRSSFITAVLRLIQTKTNRKYPSHFLLLAVIYLISVNHQE